MFSQLQPDFDDIFSTETATQFLKRLQQILLPLAYG